MGGVGGKNTFNSKLLFLFISENSFVKHFSKLEGLGLKSLIYKQTGFSIAKQSTCNVKLANVSKAD